MKPRLNGIADAMATWTDCFRGHLAMSKVKADTLFMEGDDFVTVRYNTHNTKTGLLRARGNKASFPNFFRNEILRIFKDKIIFFIFRRHQIVIWRIVNALF